MTTLKLKVVNRNGSRNVDFHVQRMINAGYVGRDRKAVLAHIEELRREGVAPPPSVPVLYPMLRVNITTSNTIEVVSDRTSGEAEYVLLLQGGKIFVGVGSDHTDRELERHSVLQSKQVCSNVMSTEVWEYEDVKDSWDTLMLRSWVREDGKAEEILYQSAPLGSILPAGELVDLVSSRCRGNPSEGLVIFSGTVPVIAGELICGSSFRCELKNRATDEALGCRYEVIVLDYVRE